MTTTMSNMNITTMLAINATSRNASSDVVLKSEYITKEWPRWIEVTVPLICIVVFVVALVIIFLKPSKPGDEPWCLSPSKKAEMPDVQFEAHQEEVTLDNGTRRPSNYVPTEFC